MLAKFKKKKVITQDIPHIKSIINNQKDKILRQENKIREQEITIIKNLKEITEQQIEINTLIDKNIDIKNKFNKKNIEYESNLKNIKDKLSGANVTNADAKLQIENDILRVELNKYTENNILCTVCWENQKEIVNMPCKHLCMCSKCYSIKNNFNDSKKCPICKSYIRNTIKIINN